MTASQPDDADASSPLPSSHLSSDRTMCPAHRKIRSIRSDKFFIFRCHTVGCPGNASMTVPYLGPPNPVPADLPLPRRAYVTRKGLLTEQLADDLADQLALALTAEGRIAVYRHGVYTATPHSFNHIVARMLGDDYRPAHVRAVTELLAGRLEHQGRMLATNLDQPLLNVANGMIHLDYGALLPHHPDYLSGSQLSLAYDPGASCPVYDAWTKSIGIDSQLDDLEECVSTMLDPTRTPQKAILLFGPSRSGKSTFLRLMTAVVGAHNTSAVTLHQLSYGMAGDRFAVANLCGKLLNCAADLSAAHLDDISQFKQLTGEDPIHANRKYGPQFTFTNKALFAFSANEPPSISEASQAYFERVKPFAFAESFIGREDPSIEATMLSQELPGLLTRWVFAGRRLRSRGWYRGTDPAIQTVFETASDRVRQFLADACLIHPASAGAYLPGHQVTGRRPLVNAYHQWAAHNGARQRMPERQILARLAHCPGVFEVRVADGLQRGARGFNVTVTDFGWSTTG